MRNRIRAAGSQTQRRWIGVVILLLAVGIAWVVIPRLGARSPIAIVLLCAVAVLTMKLVERRVHRWFRRWAERHAASSSRPRAQR